MRDFIVTRSSSIESYIWRKANYFKSLCCFLIHPAFCFACFLLVRTFMVLLYSITFYFSSTFFAFSACLCTFHNLIRSFLCVFTLKRYVFDYALRNTSYFKVPCVRSRFLFSDNSDILALFFRAKKQRISEFPTDILCKTICLFVFSLSFYGSFFKKSFSFFHQFKFSIINFWFFLFL